MITSFNLLLKKASYFLSINIYIYYCGKCVRQVAAAIS